MPDRFLWTPLRPGQVFSRLQLPFLTGIVLIPCAVAVAVPVIDNAQVMLAGMFIAALASSLLLIPSRRWFDSSWVIIVPLLDIVAIALVRAPLQPLLPAVGMLCLFPFAWIAYRFRWPGLLVVLAGGIFIASFPFALGGQSVTTPIAALNVITLPLIATGISGGIHLGSLSFQRGRRHVETAARELRQALEHSRDDQLVLRSVIDTFNGAVAFYNARNELELANAAAERLVATVGFRLDVPPYAGHHVLMADRRTEIPFEEQIIPRALRGEVIASHMEWLGSPGNQIAILASSRRVHRDDGSLLGTVIAAYDVTELANAIQVREEFLTTVSHELRTPLTSIIGFTDEVIDTLGPRAAHLGVDVFLATISRNADTLLERVNDLLTAADKTIELEPVTTDLVALLTRTATPLQLAAQRAGISLITRLPSELWAELDPARITQAVENLLTNAIKFTARGGTVTISAEDEGNGNVLITVSDTGIGMTVDEQRRVFDRFYRAQTVRENAIQGIGVGLSIVKAIVDRHRGRVTIESEPGAGSTISICVPRLHDVAS